MRFIVIIFLILCVNLGFSQNTYSYLGTLILSNNTPISFSLQLQEDNGIVNGYSITNINTPDETKSEISGLYFKKEKSFQLTETQILQTKSEAALNTFCYISMNLSFKGKFGTKRLEGTFTGNFLDSIECASGKIILMEKEKLEKKIEKIKKKVEKIQQKEQDTTLVKRTQILKEGEDFTIYWESNKVKLFIWDANMEDGDKITLTINGNIILDDFETTNKRKKIKYKLAEGENTIEIMATNLGTSPPNTSRIELVDSKTKYPIITQLKLGKTAIIKIIK
jgi:predicted secreted protein